MSRLPYFYDEYYAADQLHIPVNVVRLLRRALDPNLSFEEHSEIFPLDLGEAWNLAGYSATKRYQDSADMRKNGHPTCVEFLLETFLRRSKIRNIMREWDPVYRQFATIFHYGLMDQCFPPTLDNEAFVFQQSFVSQYFSQRITTIHVDDKNTKAAFRDGWKPPTSIQLFLRDNDPNPIFFKGLDKIPTQAIDQRRTDSARETRLEDVKRIRTLIERKLEEKGLSDELAAQFRCLETNLTR